MADVATTGYTVDDVDRLRDEIGVAHLELDPWGSLIVSPADDNHEIAQGRLVVRRVDRSRKLTDYRLGGAEKYLLVDLPANFELHDFTADTVVTSAGSIEFDVGGRRLRLELP